MLLCYSFLPAVSMNVLLRALSPQLVVLLLKISSNFLILFSCGLPVGLNNHLSVPTGPQEMRKEEKEKGRARMFEKDKGKGEKKKRSLLGRWNRAWIPSGLQVSGMAVYKPRVRKGPSAASERKICVGPCGQ